MQLVGKNLFKRGFATVEKVPVVETANFLSGNHKKSDCKAIEESFRKYGCVILRDPRVNEKHNDEFLDLMERYFESRGKQFYNNQKIEEIKPEFNYQVGATGEYTERARAHSEIMDKLKPEHKPASPQKPVLDAKWRYFWRMEDAGHKYEQNLPQIIPKDFPEWETIMNRWGTLMVSATKTAAEMLAVGMDLEKDTFRSRMDGGDHLLAPTGSDLSRYKMGTIFAGFHYDLNFITIHGKSRFPGLKIWLRTGEKIPVAVPDGCLLLQSGIQLEMLTGGHIQAGFHEVVYNDKTEEAYQKAVKNGKSTWRISSTLFSHIRQDVILGPLEQFKNLEGASKYKYISAKEQVLDELRHINLAPSQ